MLIIALVLAVIGLAALVTAVVTGNALIAWVCIVASVAGVLLLIVDAVRERSRNSAGRGGTAAGAAPADNDAEDLFDADYPDDTTADDTAADGTADNTADDRVDDRADDTRAVPFDERHEDGSDEVGADHPEEPTTR